MTLTIWMEHLGGKLDHGRLVGVVLAEHQLQLESAVLERGVLRPEYDGVPHHYVVADRGAADPCRRVVRDTGLMGTNNK